MLPFRESPLVVKDLRRDPSRPSSRLLCPLRIERVRRVPQHRHADVIKLIT